MDTPRAPGNYPDREVDCQMALEPAFQAVIDEAVETGWERSEVLIALYEISLAIASAEEENGHVSNLLWKAFKSPPRLGG
ncbi:hypothetical protein MUU53_21885 [Rhizobium lemnae]|uniref:hypothetical protein n=1 Tax=Rhizobium lemnae TaxID=1214924 RepID=UPI001FF6E56E|nr:hypothetical protein [Rhizobium lemnae]MCJ8510520.1 hypothetical protein [Rhizobium lemnae]